jgi:hypothetical protein
MHATLGNAVCYLLGIAAAIVLSWGLWMQKQPAGTAWMPYWRQHAATNLTSAIVALLAMSLWLSGNLSGLAGLFHDTLAGIGVTVPEKEIPVEMGTSAIAGAVIDVAARSFVRRIATFFENGHGAKPGN